MWAGPRNFSSINLKFEHGMRHHRLFFSHHDSWAGGQPHIPLRTNSDQSIILKGFQYSVVPFPFYLCQHFSAELEPSQKTMPPNLWLTSFLFMECYEGSEWMGQIDPKLSTGGLQSALKKLFWGLIFLTIVF